MAIATKITAGLAVVAASAATMIEGAGIALAATPAPHVMGHTVAVDIDHPLEGQSCLGMLVPPAAAAEIAGAAVAGGGDLMAIVRALGNRPDVLALKGPGAFGFHLPATLPGQPGKLWAENVPTNVYALAVVCMSGNAAAEPHIFPILVGDPIAAFAGSAG